MNVYDMLHDMLHDVVNVILHDMVTDGVFVGDSRISSQGARLAPRAGRLIATLGCRPPSRYDC